MIDAVEERNGPEPRREPGVECIFVLTQIRKLQVFASGLLTCQLQSGFGRFGHHEFFLLGVGRADIVGRNAMSPPQLSADAPILNVGQPVFVGVFVLCRIETNVIFHDGREGEIGKVLHAEIPLHAKARFYGSVGVALRVTHFIVVVFYFFEEAGGSQILCDLFANGHSVLSYVHAGRFRQGSVGIEDINRFKIVLLAEHVVVGVVSGRDFQATGSKFNIDIAVFDHGDDAIHKRDAYFLSLQPAILRVFGVNAHRSVAHDGFGAGCGHNGVASFLIAVDDFAFCAGAGAVIVHNVVFEIVEFAFLFAINDLFVGKCSLGFGIPVDHTEATIDKSLVEEVNKDFDHAFAAFFVHRKGCAVPIAGGTELSKLF